MCKLVCTCVCTHVCFVSLYVCVLASMRVCACMRACDIYALASKIILLPAGCSIKGIAHSLCLASVI